MGTFSKSLASLGGYMAADKVVVDYVRHTSRPFMFSASLPPANAASALYALRYLIKHPELPEKLKSISNYTRTCFKKHGIKILEAETETPIVPIYTKEQEYTLILGKNLFNGNELWSINTKTKVSYHKKRITTEQYLMYKEQGLIAKNGRINEVGISNDEWIERKNLILIT